jgi:ferredoxin--NADP+ reductase
MLAEKHEGDVIADFAGPLGTASHLEGIKKVAVIGGGVGCAIAYPQAKKLHGLGAKVDVIAGFRNKNIIILEDEFKKVSDHLFITTDDGSNGTKGFVTDVLRDLIEKGNRYDAVIAIGPLIMMKVVSELTRPYGIKTVVSMNPIMIDGTGMCGGCRLTVGGEIKFACVDGPDFDGHKVDFDEAIRRSRMYSDEERKSMHKYECNLIKGVE